MFFKKATDEEKVYTEKAVRLTFVYFMITLFISASLAIFRESTANHSYLILMGGVLVFFVSGFLFKKFTKP